MTRQSQIRAQKKYDEKVMRILLRINPDTDPDIIALLESKKSKQGYLRELLKKAALEERQQ